MPDKKEKLSKEELIEKINNERIAFREAMKFKDRECDTALKEIQVAMDMIVARFVRSFGIEKEPGIWTVDLPRPTCPDGKRWVTSVTRPDDEIYRIQASMKDVDDTKRG